MPLCLSTPLSTLAMPLVILGSWRSKSTLSPRVWKKLSKRLVSWWPILGGRFPQPASEPCDCVDVDVEYENVTFPLLVTAACRAEELLVYNTMYLGHCH